MKRILTAILGLALTLGITIAGPRWLFVLAVVLVAGLGLDEFLRMAAARGRNRPGPWLLATGPIVTLAFATPSERPLWILSALIANLILLSIVGLGAAQGSTYLDYFQSGAAGIVYVCLLSGAFLGLSVPELWVLLTTVWTGDTAAYYGGRLLGRHPLAPALSPKKTVEGSLTGGAASVLAAAAFGVVLLDLPILVLLAIGLITGVTGQLGDLVESAMKRTAGVKDSSSRLPGHGGILDRIDSLLTAGPVFLFLITVWGR